MTEIEDRTDKKGKIVMRVIGYARVSTNQQNLDMQIDAIHRYAADRNLEPVLYVEKESSRSERPELNNALKAAAPGDIFVIYKLDRLARSTKELYSITEELRNKGASFVSISDHFDTTTPSGKAMFGLLAVFAEFERDIIQERTKEGLESARKRGRVGGRPRIDDSIKRKVRALYAAGEGATDIAKEYGLGRATVYKILKEETEK